MDTFELPITEVKPRTGQYWYNMLQRGVKSKVKRNTIKRFGTTYWEHVLKGECSCMYIFLVFTVMNDSPEGTVYWNKINKMYNEKI